MHSGDVLLAALVLSLTLVAVTFGLVWLLVGQFISFFKRRQFPGVSRSRDHSKAD